MQRALPLFLIAVLSLTGCNKSKSADVPANSAGAVSNAAASSNDPVQAKLQELAGTNAKNCGLLKTQGTPEMEAASTCVMDAAKAKSAFYVEYQMPGMNVALAGNTQGKMYSVQSQEGGAGLASTDCPAELRVAPSGRVTCYAPGTFPMNAGAGSHATMPTMPSMMGSGSNPHGAKGALPPGHPAVNQPPPSK